MYQSVVDNTPWILLHLFLQLNSHIILSHYQVMQNRILKMLYKLDWYTHTNDMHRNLSLLKVKDIFHLQVVKFVYKQKNNLLPPTFKHYFITNAQVHHHQTRQAGNIHASRPRTGIGAKCMKVSGMKIYNALPNHLLQCHSLHSFKGKASHHYISLY